MKKRYFVRCLFVLSFAFSLFNCTSNQKSNDVTSENVSEEKTMSETDEGTQQDSQQPISNGNNVFGTFHWGITDDAFCKLLTLWEKKNTINGSIVIADLKLKNDGLKPKFDKSGHLDGMILYFTDFSIHPEPDYTDEELSEIKRLCLKHNQKIKHLMETFSEKYGDPISQDFSEDSDDMYLSNGTKKIAQWQNDVVKVILFIENETPSGAEKGCKLKMWVNFEK